MSDIPYTPIPSIGHELGIMFGFIALMLLCAGSYYVGFKRFQKRVEKEEEDRRTALRQSPLYSEKYDEKGRQKQEFVESVEAKKMPVETTEKPEPVEIKG